MDEVMCNNVYNTNLSLQGHHTNLVLHDVTKVTYVYNIIVRYFPQFDPR